MIYTPQPPSPLVNNWVERHRDPKSFLLHLIGIPCTILGVLLLPIYSILLSIPVFVLALILFLGGFAVQFLGHALEGSEPGEIKALRLWMGRRRESRLKPSGLQVALPDVERG
jgi:uncharacterized membrane protein YGL010W